MSNALLEVGSVCHVMKCHNPCCWLSKKSSWGCGKEMNERGWVSPSLRILPQVKEQGLEEILGQKDGVL